VAGSSASGLAAGLVMFFVLSGSALAADDLLPPKSASVRDRSRPEYAPVGIDLGALRLSPGLSAGLAYDDNVYASENAETTDVITVVTGDLGLSSSGGIVPIELRASAISLSYADNPQEDRVDWEAGFSGSYGGERRTSLNFSADLQNVHESRGDPSFPTAAANPPRSTTTGGALGLQHRFATGELSLQADYRSRNFQDAALFDGSILDQDFRDRDSLLVEAQTTFAIRRSVGALLRVTRRQQDYKYRTESGLNRDSVSNAVYGGTAFEITNLMRGQVGVGVLKLDNRDARESDRTSLAVSANIEFYATQLMTLTLDVQRTAGAADIEGSASYIGTNASIRMDYEVRRNLIITSVLSTFRRDYTGLPLSESTHRATMGARWLLNRRLTVSGDYSWEQGRWPPERGNRNFTQGIASVTLGLAL
jgi:hypothetical protein